METTANAKVVCIILLIIAAIIFAAKFKKLRGRFYLPFGALALYVLIGGASCFYAISGKFALKEFIKPFNAFLIAFILTVVSPEDKNRSGSWLGIIYSVFAATVSLVSIDMISTRTIGSFFIALLSPFTDSYSSIGFIEPGVRITSLYTNPNVFASICGLGIILSLSLILSSESAKSRFFRIVLLFICTLGFTLAFSMGATLALGAALIIFFIFEKREKKAELLLLFAADLALCVVAAVLISATSFDSWSGFQPVPMLCLIIGAALLCLIDKFAISGLSAYLSGKLKLLYILIAAFVALAAVFLVIAINFTGAASLSAGEALRRAEYPAPGSYNLEITGTGDVSITIESQNREETIMHTSTVLYSGDARSAAFTVPDDSLVCYFNFKAESDSVIEKASFGSYNLPLDYKLLPGFVANRLQGLLANENAIQRFAFFEDGLKLWRQSPIIGLGLGAFESALKSVQEFFYETKYVHNHYIQTMLETGIIGLLSFLSLFGVSAAAVIIELKKENRHTMAAALIGSLAFMAIHAAIEVIFSFFAYLPIAYGAFALLNVCCGENVALKLPKKAQNGVIIGFTVCAVVFGVLLGMNMAAQDTISRNATFNSLETAISLDRFEWADAKLSYVYSAMNNLDNPQIVEKADEYARDLESVRSNIIPYYVSAYYFSRGRTADAMAQGEKFVRYVISDGNNWNMELDLIRSWESDLPEYTDGVKRLAELYDSWSAENMGSIGLSEENAQFLAIFRG